MTSGHVTPGRLWKPGERVVLRMNMPVRMMVPYYARANRAAENHWMTFLRLPAP